MPSLHPTNISKLREDFKCPFTVSNSEEKPNTIYYFPLGDNTWVYWFFCTNHLNEWVAKYLLNSSDKEKITLDQVVDAFEDNFGKLETYYGIKREEAVIQLKFIITQPY